MNELLGKQTKTRLKHGIVPHLNLKPSSTPTTVTREKSGVSEKPNTNLVSRTASEASDSANSCLSVQEIQQKIERLKRALELIRSKRGTSSSLTSVIPSRSLSNKTDDIPPFPLINVKKKQQESAVKLQVEVVTEAPPETITEEEEEVAVEEVTRQDVINKYRRAVGYTHHYEVRGDDDEPVIDRKHKSATDKKVKSDKNLLLDGDSIYVVRANTDTFVIPKESCSDPSSLFMSEMVSVRNVTTVVDSRQQFLHWLGEDFSSKPIMCLDGMTKTALMTFLTKHSREIADLKECESKSKDKNLKVNRSRERFQIDRKLKELEPLHKKLKSKVEELRQFRKTKLKHGSIAESKKALVRQRRKRRREWLQDQIKAGKMDKSAIVLVHSNKILPYEEEEKKAKRAANATKRILKKNELNVAITSIEYDGVPGPVNRIET